MNNLIYFLGVLLLSRISTATPSISLHGATQPVATVAPSLEPLTQAPPVAGAPQIPQSAVRAAVAEANALAGTDAKITFNPLDTSKVFIEPNGTGTGKLAGTDPRGAIGINPKELEKVVPGCTAPGNEVILHDILIIVLAHEFEHLNEANGGFDSEASATGGDPPREIPTCDHLKQYKKDGTRICNRLHDLVNGQLSLEEKCKRAAALCKLHAFFKSKNNDANNSIALACTPSVAVPIVADCAHCPGAGFECPTHHHVY